MLEGMKKDNVCYAARLFRGHTDAPRGPARLVEVENRLSGLSG